ncbi:MAG: DUF5684 domain-containing protein [Planctomycetota bacterium]|nr:DUF5684 domain-containing protein [Planctomycetota bacterium]
MEIYVVLYLILIVLSIAGMWKTFTKAGQPGWASIIPIYNIIILLEIAGKPTWWILLWMFVPVVNLVVAIIVSIAIAENFGKGAGFGVGLAFLAPIFYAILGFGDAQYTGGVATPSSPPPAPGA